MEEEWSYLFLPYHLWKGNYYKGIYSIQDKKVLEPNFLMLPVSTIQNEDGSSCHCALSSIQCFLTMLGVGQVLEREKETHCLQESGWEHKPPGRLVNLQLRSSQGWKLPGAPGKLWRGYFANPETDILTNCKWPGFGSPKTWAAAISLLILETWVLLKSRLCTILGGQNRV